MAIFICDVCSKEFSSKQSLGGHKSSAHKDGPRYSVKRHVKQYQSCDRNFQCRYCGSERKNHNSWRNHERCCASNPNREYKNEKLGKKGSNQYIYASQHNLPKPVISDEGRKRLSEKSSRFRHTDETRKKISERMSINNKGGRCKWFDVSGQKVQGTWERDIATKLDEMRIKWTKLKTNKDTLQYILGGKQRSYTPDFYLEEYGLFLEIKGFWWGNDRDKMQAVIEQHPEKKIVIIEKKEYDTIMGGELVW